jgi:anthranilate/para-aminobenzoate synthase component II
MAVRVLMIDNYDSFTYNLVQYLGELGAELEVGAQRRRDRRRTARAPGYDRVVVSARPVHAQRGRDLGRGHAPLPAGRRALARRLPGHQSLAQAFGGRVVRHVPVHGKTTEITHDGRHLRGPAEPAARRALSLARSWIPICPTAWRRPRTAAAC